MKSYITGGCLDYILFFVSITRVYRVYLDNIISLRLCHNVTSDLRVAFSGMHIVSN